MWPFSLFKKKEEPKDLDTVCREEIAKYCTQYHATVRELLTQIEGAHDHHLTQDAANWEYLRKQPSMGHEEHVYSSCIDSLVAICSVKPSLNTKVYRIDLDIEPTSS